MPEEPRYAPVAAPQYQPSESYYRDTPQGFDEINDRLYVKPHAVTYQDEFAVDRAVNNYAQQREWNDAMLKTSNYNDYI